MNYRPAPISFSRIRQWRFCHICGQRLDENNQCEQCAAHWQQMLKEYRHKKLTKHLQHEPDAPVEPLPFDELSDEAT